ncbi:MAG: hypothetical protein ACRDD1_01515, partial [Planctomycetia bacterium]
MNRVPRSATPTVFRFDALEDRAVPAVLTVAEVESNNVRTVPQVLPGGNVVEVRGSIADLPDVDFYAVPVSAGQLLSVNVAAVGGDVRSSDSLDPIVAIFDPNGTEVAFSDDTGIGSRWAAGATITTTVSGFYLIGVSKFNDRQFNGSPTSGPGLETGNYAMTYRLADANAPNVAPVLDVSMPPPRVTTVVSSGGLSIGALTSGRLVDARSADGDAGPFSDADEKEGRAIQRGVAITQLRSTSRGRFEFSLNGGRTWTTARGVSSTRSLLLRETDRVRFVRANGSAGRISLQYRAWDRSSGRAGRM